MAARVFVVLAFTVYAVFAHPIHADAAQKDTIEFVSPIKHQLVLGKQVSAQIRFNQPVDLSSFKAELNGRNVTRLFSLSPSGGQVTLKIEDGLKATPETTGQKHAPNKIEVEIEVPGVKGKSKKEKAKVHFFLDASQTGDTPTRIVRIIPPTGGSLSLPGFGTVEFPAGAFSTDQEVEFAITADPESINTYDISGVIFGAGPRLAYELRINTRLIQPATPFGVIVEVPASFLTQIPAGYETGTYTQIRSEGDEEILDNFELFFSSYSALNNTSTATLPATAFTNKRTLDGTYEAVIVLGTSPLRPIIGSTSSNLLFGRTFATQSTAYTCETHSDPHKVLAPPLDGRLIVKDGFKNPRQNHFGVDYATRSQANIPVEGLPVRALQDGIITTIGVQLSAPQNQPCNIDNGTRSVQLGWGQYVVITHVDGSRSLYAHLQQSSAKKPVGAKITKDEIFALSGSTGTYSPRTCGPAPHLHAEFVPNGNPPQLAVNNPYKVDLVPCVSRHLYVANPGNFYGDPGFIRQYDVAQNYSYSSFPSGLSDRATRWVAAFNRGRYVTGVNFVTLDGNHFAYIGSEPYSFAGGIASNRFGITITENALGTGADAQVYFFRHNGSGGGVFKFISGNPLGSGEWTVAASDERLILVNYEKSLISDISGLDINVVPASFVTYVGAATKDRLYLVDHVDIPFSDFYAYVRVFDNNGGELASVPGLIPGRVFGIAVTEKNLYVSASDNGRVLIYDRHVVRNNNGGIVSDTYVFAGVLPEPGFPMGLAAE